MRIAKWSAKISLFDLKVQKNLNLDPSDKTDLFMGHIQFKGLDGVRSLDLKIFKLEGKIKFIHKKVLVKIEIE